ncbi:MAG: amino acid aminotransferase [Phycisphaeraceae bacterium]|nr:amino acid aminotransferase [Phycisphaeraceae bacterium]
MFESVPTAPPDPILGLTEAFGQDPNPQKINLSVGVYKDETGHTPILESVKAAEQRIFDAEKTKAYKPIAGDPVYGKLVRQLLFGVGHELNDNGRAFTAHCPGGTGALRVVGDYLKHQHSGSAIWLSDPTWANHGAVFAAAGVKTRAYPYFDPAVNGLDFEAMFSAVKQMPAGDVILLHGCCHNPTGVDPSAEQWDRLGQLLAERGVVPLVDFAYQGFAAGLEDDAAGLRALVRWVDELIICSSFSKNFGLYNERTGALTFVGREAGHVAAVASQLKLRIRTNYSNPPAHGGAIVAMVLADSELKSRWNGEVAQMRDRINGMRGLLVKTLADKGAGRDFSFITSQSGMFSFSGLSGDQVQALRQNHSIYIVGSGRINVAGITPGNIDRLCEAIVSVL